MNRRALALVAAGTAVLAGCGIRADSRPRDIAAGDAPLTLSANVASAPGTTAAPGNPKVYLLYIDGVHLIGSNRDAASLDDLLRALLEGPTQQDNDHGSTSAIPLNTTLVKTEINSKILTITLQLDPTSPQGFVGANGPNAFAQLVFTATSDATKVNGVKFIVNGQPIGVDGDGKPVAADHPLTRSDFSRQAPVVTPDVKPPGGSLVTTTTTTTSTLPPTTTATSTTVAPTATPATT